jgi:uncharacterized membrane protein YbhN (UPF0104 family)
VTLLQHLLAVGLVVADVAARGMRIRQLLPVSLGRAMMINTSGDALAAVTPARMGGEPVRFLGFRRAGGSAGAVLAAFTTEVGVDIVVLAVITGLLSAWVARGSTWSALDGARWVSGLWWVGALLAGVAGLVVWAWRGRFRARLGVALRDARDALRNRSWAALGPVAFWTVASVAARTAILPVLVLGVPGVSWGAVVAGSFALVFGQGVLPIPGGLGAMDLGLALGFSSLLKGAALARLLLAWRFYSLVLGALAGALLLAWTAWERVRDRATPTPLLDPIAD